MEEQNLVKELTMPIFQAKGWLKLLGVVMIVYGVLIAISIVGIIVAWLPIWLGVLLFQAAGKAEAAQISGQKQQLLESLHKIRMYFVINGVLMLVMLIVMGVGLIIGGGAMFGALGNM